MKRIASILKIQSRSDKELTNSIKNIAGISPRNIKLYQLALIHTSAAKEDTKGLRHSNERLEYLGDAVLDLIIAEHLFKKFPYKDEGFLTDIRSRIVNREALTNLAKKIGLDDLVVYDKKRNRSNSYKSMMGDALEALVGAVYLDRGYRFCRKFVLEKLIFPNYDLSQVIEEDPNYKSRIIEWGQKNDYEIRFEIIQVAEENNRKQFTAQVCVNDKPISTGHGLSKKKAEQDAAMKSWVMLNEENNDQA